MVVDKIPISYEISSHPGVNYTNSGDIPIIHAKYPVLTEEESLNRLSNDAKFAVFSGCLPRTNTPPKKTLIYDLTKYDIVEIVAGEDFAIMRNRSGHCYLLADESDEKVKIWKNWLGIGDVVLNGKDAVLIPFTVDDPIEMVFCHAFCVFVNKIGEVYYYPESFGTTVPQYYGKLDCELFEGERIVHCALGNEHALLLTCSGQLYGFGANSSGQLATGRWYSEHKFMKVETSQISEKIVKVYATYNTSLVLTETNEVWSCGDSTYNATGHISGTNSKTNELVKLPLNEKIIDIETGLFFVAMKTITNKYLVFGYNNFSQFGKSLTLTERIDGPHELDTFANENIHTIACGGYNSIIISQDRKYYISGWTIDSNFYPSQDSCYNFIDMKTFLGINGPFIDLGVELCATMGRYFSIFYSRESLSRIPLNFKKSFKICDITIKTQNGEPKGGSYPNCMEYYEE